MDTLVAVEVCTSDWVGNTILQLRSLRKIYQSDAVDAVNYCWGYLSRDDLIQRLVGRYLSEYSEYLTVEDIIDYDDVDVDFLNDIFAAISEEILGALKDFYDLGLVQIGTEGLYYYLVDEIGLLETRDTNITGVRRSHDQLYVGLGG